MPLLWNSSTEQASSLSPRSTFLFDTLQWPLVLSLIRKGIRELQILQHYLWMIGCWESSSFFEFFQYFYYFWSLWQTQSLYVRRGAQYSTLFLSHSVSTSCIYGPVWKLLTKQTSAGSSFDSVVGVAAGFASLSIEAETDGSVVQPITKAALYGLKISHGLTELASVLPGALLFDCLGGFAKTPPDLASLMNFFVQRRDFSGSLSYSWKGINVDFVDTALWKFSPSVCEPNEDFRKQLIYLHFYMWIGASSANVTTEIWYCWRPS